MEFRDKLYEMVNALKATKEYKEFITLKEYEGISHGICWAYDVDINRVDSVPYKFLFSDRLYSIKVFPQKIVLFRASEYAESGCAIILLLLLI